MIISVPIGFDENTCCHPTWQAINHAGVGVVTVAVSAVSYTHLDVYKRQE